MDGLAVVSSRPHLLGFSVRQNVSLKVSGLRALMKRERAGPKESWQEQQQQDQQHQASAKVGKCCRRLVGSLFLLEICS